MKKYIMAILIMVSYTKDLKACDVCGGAINSSTGELIPGMYSHFIGLRSNLQYFDSEHLTLFPGEEPIMTKEWFHNTEIFGRYSPHKRIQLMGFLPFNVVHKYEEGKYLSTQGLGDARIFSNFLIIDRRNEITELEINWFSGAHLKIPTGRYQFNEKEDVHFHPNMLPGTGSWDFGFQTDFIISKNNHGGMITGNYFIRGKNDRPYQFGDISSARGVYFYKKERESLSFMIELGLQYNHLQPDVDLRWNEVQDFSRGDMLSPVIRLSGFHDKWVFQANAGRPAYQNLAKGQSFQNFEVGLSIMRFI